MLAEQQNDPSAREAEEIEVVFSWEVLQRFADTVWAVGGERREQEHSVKRKRVNYDNRKRAASALENHAERRSVESQLCCRCEPF